MRGLWVSGGALLRSVEEQRTLHFQSTVRRAAPCTTSCCPQLRAPSPCSTTLPGTPARTLCISGGTLKKRTALSRKLPLVFRVQVGCEATVPILGGDNAISVLQMCGRAACFAVLDVLEFNATRKRQSLVVRTPDRKLKVLCKGADTVMLERMAKVQNGGSKIEADSVLHMGEVGEEGGAGLGLGGVLLLRPRDAGAGGGRALLVGEEEGHGVGQASVNALDKLEAGASLIQVYTGFVCRGSSLIDDILETLDQSPSI